jgi:hypothetical protein
MTWSYGYAGVPGVDFDPHWFRHGAATRMLRDGVPVEVVATLLGHSAVSTTVSTYGHLAAEDARKALQAAGWFTGGEVRLTTFEITRGERAALQRRATRELAAILNAHPDLPIIAWTVGSTGSFVVGHVNGLASAWQVRQVFDAWRTALTLTEHADSVRAGATYLRAAVHRDRVHIRLSATVLDEEDRVGTS